MSYAHEAWRRIDSAISSGRVWGGSTRGGSASTQGPADVIPLTGGGYCKSLHSRQPARQRATRYAIWSFCGGGMGRSGTVLDRHGERKPWCLGQACAVDCDHLPVGIEERAAGRPSDGHAVELNDVFRRARDDAGGHRGPHHGGPEPREPGGAEPTPSRHVKASGACGGNPCRLPRPQHEGRRSSHASRGAARPWPARGPGGSSLARGGGGREATSVQQGAVPAPEIREPPLATA